MLLMGACQPALARSPMCVQAAACKPAHMSLHEFQTKKKRNPTPDVIIAAVFWTLFGLFIWWSIKRTYAENAELQQRVLRATPTPVHKSYYGSPYWGDYYDYDYFDDYEGDYAGPFR